MDRESQRPGRLPHGRLENLPADYRRGAKIGVVNPDDGEASFVTGVHMEFTETGSRWHLMTVFYHFQDQQRATPYLGLGVTFSLSSGAGQGEF